MDEHVDDNPQHEYFDEKGNVCENGSTSEPGYAGPTHDKVCRMIREFLVGHVQDRLRRSVHERCEKVVHALLQEARQSARDNVHTPGCDVMKQVVVKLCFTWSADEKM